MNRPTFASLQITCTKPIITTHHTSSTSFSVDSLSAFISVLYKKHTCPNLQLFRIDCHGVLILQNLAEFEKSSDKVYTIDKPRTSMDNTRNTELKDKRMFCEVRRRRHIEYNLWQQVARLVSTKTWGKLFKKKNKKTNFYFLGRTTKYNLQVQNEGTFSPVTQPCVCHQGAGSLSLFIRTPSKYTCVFSWYLFLKNRWHLLLGAWAKSRATQFRQKSTKMLHTAIVPTIDSETSLMLNHFKGFF